MIVAMIACFEVLFVMLCWLFWVCLGVLVCCSYLGFWFVSTLSFVLVVLLLCCFGGLVCASLFELYYSFVIYVSV